MSDARKTLAAAHAKMKRAEIAQHALAMADILARLIETLGNQGRMLASTSSALAEMHAGIRRAQSLSATHKKKAARDLLASLAAVQPPLAAPAFSAADLNELTSVLDPGNPA